MITTKMEDDQNVRQPKWKTTKTKMTKMEVNQNGKRPRWKLAKLNMSELGTAQPQLVFIIYQAINHD